MALALLLLAALVATPKEEAAAAQKARRERTAALLEQGRLVQAKNELKAELRTLATDLEAKADVLSELGEVYVHLERHNEAVGAHEEAVELLDALHGGSDPRRWVAVGKLADSHHRLGNHAQAVALYKELVENMLAGPFGAGHPGMRITLGKLGAAAMAIQDAKSAIGAFEQLIQLAEGDDSAAALNARADANLQLARALSLRKKKAASTRSKANRAQLEKALKHARAARDIFKAIPEGDMMDVAYSTNGIAGVLELLDRDDEAIAAMEEAYRLALEAKGAEDDPDVLRAKKNSDGLRAHIERKLKRRQKPEL
ncbi:hypothetical protein AB1Y20_019846 [Prymnesium parvum]|uniref:Kinesin light chain n=1 Tax=Prymnesium parvum TaxID=97485 RepID=A0AB34JSZ1_PRYPA